jgi:hypothetical protein
LAYKKYLHPLYLSPTRGSLAVLRARIAQKENIMAKEKIINWL